MAVEKKNFFQETLKDAGCAQNTIAEFLLFQAEGREQEGIQLLLQHRQHLLADVHRAQKRIDILDYLIYTMKKSKKEQG